ncbi:MAG: hypothetical protein K5893_02775 [Prevotella sp.]|nr:hypothetical protein [Prevotella sp.]
MRPQTLKPKIKFYKLRNFGELINVTFDFIRENWKPLMRYITYLVLPVVLLQGATMGSFLESYMTGFSNMEGATNADGLLASIGRSYVLTILFALVGYFVVSAVSYILMKLYDERDNRLEGITFADIKPLLWPVLRRVFTSFAFAVIVAVAVILLIAGSINIDAPFFVFIIFIVGAVFLVPYNLVTPLYVFEECPFSEALMRGYRLGFKSFWFIVSLTILLAIIEQFISGIISMPMSIFITVKTMLGLDGDNFANGPLMTILGYFSSCIYTFVNYLLTPILIIGSAYLYSHTVEKEDNLTNRRDIDNFEQMNEPLRTDIDNFDQLV